MKLKNLTRSVNQTKSSAFTIVEVVVGMALAGISLVSLYAGFFSGFQIIGSARENLRATQVMLEKLETIRLYTWEQINGSNNYVIPTTFTNYYNELSTTNKGIRYDGTLTIVPAPFNVTYSADLKLITVNVFWTSYGRTKTNQMLTLVAHQGLQSYVY